MHDVLHSDRSQRLRSVGSRRRHRYSHICALTSALLLLFSVSLLYNRLSSNEDVSKHRRSHYDPELNAIQQNTLLSDTDDGSDSSSFDQIDELDFAEVEDKDENNDPIPGTILRPKKMVTSGYYVDHITGVIRRALNKRSIDDWDYDYGGAEPFAQVFAAKEGNGPFGSDDVVIDADVREKIGLVETIEDALLLKVGTRGNAGLRAGWGDWFEKKGDFLRRDRMFRSNLEALNPLNNPMLQDPDGIGLTGLTRGDKAIRKWYIDQIQIAPPLVKKSEQEMNIASRVLSRKLLNAVRKSDVQMLNRISGNEKVLLRWKGNELSELEDKRGERKHKTHYNEIAHMYSNGRWGYFPDLDAQMTFSNFVKSFFERCEVKIFMVWNSPAWMFGVRHQRAIESLLTIHRDACVMMLSETMDLDFFKGSFVKKGFKVAVAMPNLDELLKDTPAHLFCSRWRQWRTTKSYPIRYSELVRLAALYK